MEKVFIVIDKISNVYGSRKESFDLLMAILIAVVIIFLNQGVIYEICNLNDALIGTAISFLGVILALSLIVSSFLFVYFPKNPRMIENFKNSSSYRPFIKTFLEIIFCLAALIVLLVIELRGSCGFILSGLIFFFIIFCLLRFFKFLYYLSKVDV
jgi:hypothetical protein